MFEIKNQNQKDLDDLIQNWAWRLVRSAEDRMGGGGNGKAKFEWCVARLSYLYPNLHKERVDDYIRSAYMQFKIEFGMIERRQML